MRHTVFVSLLALSVAGCGAESESAAETSGGAASAAENSAAKARGAERPVTDPRDVAFAPTLDVDLNAMERRESGLYVKVLQEGDGSPATAGDSLYVHYTVWFPDGRKLDSSFDREPPAPLPMALGETRLIEGWTEGVTGMRLGEKRRLVVPHELAYGAAGRPPRVPPYSVLVFEVERVGPGGS